MAEVLRGVGQRLSDGERTWEAEKRSLEGHLNRTQHSMREAQANADQLRWAMLTTVHLAPLCATHVCMFQADTCYSNTAVVPSRICAS